ncbi:glutaredoxin-like domain protein [Longilinea arvoryzae]|uniref:Glutaredoxin-like domain protein n=1 Tax=Longilinea arvoryzae TaxID=360412 RepID=A0A0S7BK06_9CHLR|nr:thioredoxin family protein [Longilinea arvoryzae]GAP14133.1 glutaredoxin-like domain protein [Longilinea arvoryzae]
MEKLLNTEIEKQLREIFADLKQPVTVLLFTSQEECDLCGQTRQLLEEVSALDEKIDLRVLDIQADAGLTKQYRIDKTPALTLLAGAGDQLTDYGIRYYGVPAGHEFTSLVHDLLLVSGGESGLNEKTRQFLSGLKKPVHLQVFVTPTCPYCPSAVVLAHRMALESPMVTADMVEATEFPELSEHYGVSGVPHTVINDGAGELIGANPEEALVAEIELVLK